jgi:hypothetical protein
MRKMTQTQLIKSSLEIRISDLKELDQIVEAYYSAFERSFRLADGTIETTWGNLIPNNWELVEAGLSAYSAAALALEVVIPSMVGKKPGYQRILRLIDAPKLSPGDIVYKRGGDEPLKVISTDIVKHAKKVGERDYSEEEPLDEHRDNATIQAGSMNGMRKMQGSYHDFAMTPTSMHLDPFRLTREGGLGRFIEPWMMELILGQTVMQRLLSAHQNQSNPYEEVYWQISKFFPLLTEGRGNGRLTSQVGALMPDLEKELAPRTGMGFLGLIPAEGGRKKCEERLWEIINSDYSTYSEVFAAASYVNDISVIRRGTENARRITDAYRALIHSYEKYGIDTIKL